MDTVTPEKRSQNMAAIKSKDTKPELFIRKLLFSKGYRYSLYAQKVPGHPDLYMRKYNTAVFVHGCFWHRHTGCRYCYMPKSRVTYWEKKFQGNIDRDIIVKKQLLEKGKREKVNLFCARLCYSCRPVVLAYHRQNEESFLDAFVRSFQILGGTPVKVIFDNGKVAVKDGFGSHAKKQEGYTHLSAHYGFTALFCNPAEGHEKGLVEGLVGWSRRNILVPVPRVETLTELNETLLERCQKYEAHKIQGKPDTVGAMYRLEKESLRSLPRYTFETAKCTSVRVNAFSTVCFRTNRYSVPVAYAGRIVGIKAYPETIEVYCDGAIIAEHERCFGQHQSRYRLEDYLPLLEIRGRALLNAAPVRQNIPPEILQQWQEEQTDHKTIIAFLKAQAETKPPRIKDPVLIRAVDLHEYDTLKEAAYV